MASSAQSARTPSRRPAAMGGAVETQATDRAHRIGQRNAVMVYRYVSVDTIEAKVMELKQHKADLFASVMDADGSLSGALSDEDVRGLLELSG